MEATIIPMTNGLRPSEEPGAGGLEPVLGSPRHAGPGRGRSWLTRRQIAAHFRVSPRTIGNFMRKAILPSHRLDQLMRFDPVECDRAFAKFKCAAVHEGRAAVPAGPDGTDWRTKDQIADHFRCSYRTVGNLMQRRVLPFVKLGNVVRFDFAECEAIMARAKTASVYDR